MFKKLLTSSLLSLIALGGFFVNVEFDENSHMQVGTVDSSYAANVGDYTTAPSNAVPGAGTSTVNQNAEIQKVLNALVAGINIVLSLLTIIVSPAIMLASWLMTPDWTVGDIFGIRPVIHKLWITISNITYFIYAILLIFIALATIFNSTNYGYKQLLPKLALGIILVPMTWWFVQFTISLATTITASVVSIPMETLQKTLNKDPESWWNKKVIPKDIQYASNYLQSEGERLSNTGAIDKICGANGESGKCLSPADLTEKSAGLFSPLLIYSFGVFKIQNVRDIRTPSVGVDLVISIFDIIHQGIIGALMFIVYGLLVIALIFMLLMRAMKLWFYAIFSPLLTLKYVLGDKIFGGADKDGSFQITEFIGLAFVPAVVSLALSMGLIIVSALYTPFDSKTNPNNKCDNTTCTINIMGSTDNTIVSTVTKEAPLTSETKVTLGGLTYTYRGSVDGAGAVSGLKSALGATGNLFGTIIIDIIALVFIWMAFMAGKGVSKAAGAAIEPFEKLGKSIAGTASSLPKYAPILPGGMSVKGLEKSASLIDQGFAKKADEKYEQTDAGKFLKKWSGAAGSGDVAKYREASNMEGHNAADAMKKAMQNSISTGNGEQIWKDNEIKKLTETFYEKVKTDKINENDISRSGIDSGIAKELVKKIKDGKYTSDDDKKILAAWMAGNNEISLNGSSAEKWLKKTENSKAASQPNIAASTIANNTVINFQAGNEFIKYDIAKKSIGDLSENDTKELAKITRKEFLSSADKLLTDSQMKELEAALNQKNIEFRKDENK